MSTGSASQQNENLKLVTEVRTGNTLRVEAMLNAGASVNGSEQLRPLMTAVFFGLPTMVDFLIRKGADVDAPTINRPEEYTNTRSLVYLNFEGERPLHVATYSGRVDIVRLLLRAGANPNAANICGHTPLMALCSNTTGRDDSWRDIMQALLQAGADLSLVDKEGFPPLFHAYAGGRMDIIRAVISNAPHTLNQRGSLGQSALLMAAKDSPVNVLQHLRSERATHRRILEHDSGPLTAAVVNGHKNVVRTLTKYGSDPIGGLCVSPIVLTAAVCYGQSKVLHFLLGAGGEEDQQKWSRYDGNLAGPLLHYAAGFIQLSSVKLLLVAGANPEARDRVGQRAIDVIATMDPENPPTSPLEPRVADRKRDPVMEAEIYRTLMRGPAYLAWSWAWPTAATPGCSNPFLKYSDHKERKRGRRKNRPGVRVLRQRTRKGFARAISRYGFSWWAPQLSSFCSASEIPLREAIPRK